MEEHDEHHASQVSRPVLEVLRRASTDDHVHRPNVEAKYANGMLAVRIPAPRAAMPEQSKSRLPDESADGRSRFGATGPRPGLRPQPARER